MMMTGSTMSKATMALGVYRMSTVAASTAFQHDIKAIDLNGHSDAVHRVFSFNNASQREVNQRDQKDMIEKFQLSEGNTGCTEVQVALLTSKITYLTNHMKTNPKDFSSRRGLEAHVQSRRDLLKYLKRTKYARYMSLIERLSLRDTIKVWPTDQ